MFSAGNDSMQDWLKSTVAGAGRSEVIFDVQAERSARRLGCAFLRSHQDSDGRISLEIEVQRDADEPRPMFWESLKKELKQRGFEFVIDDWSGSDDLFVPRTQFSAFIAMEASKQYSPQAWQEIVNDLATITGLLRPEHLNVISRS